MFKVQKKDGEVEDFQRQKIVSGIVKAGGSPDEAEKVAAAIEDWLPTVAEGDTVRAIDIRDKGLEIFRSLNPDAANAYESYQKPK